MTVDQNIAQAMNLTNGQQGVLVEQVQSGSLAEKAGLKASSKSVTINGQNVTVGGDIITAVNGQTVTSIDDLRSDLAQLPSDHPLTLTVLRDGKEMQVQVQPGL
jgi:S1-C subfamily serine protease